MKQIRARMHVRADLLRGDAQRLFTWRTLYARWPWGCLGTAAFLGFWLMPGRHVTPRVRLDEKSLDELVRRGGVRIEASSEKPNNWRNSLFSMASNMLWRGALAYVSQQLGKHSGVAASEATDEATNQPSMRTWR